MATKKTPKITEDEILEQQAPEESTEATSPSQTDSLTAPEAEITGSEVPEGEAVSQTGSESAPDEVLIAEDGPEELARTADSQTDSEKENSQEFSAEDAATPPPTTPRLRLIRKAPIFSLKGPRRLGEPGKAAPAHLRLGRRRIQLPNMHPTAS